MRNSKSEMSDTRKALEYWRIFHWGEKIAKNLPCKFEVKNEDCGVSGHVDLVNAKLEELQKAVYELLDRESDFLTEEEIEEL